MTRAGGTWSARPPVRRCFAVGFIRPVIADLDYRSGRRIREVGVSRLLGHGLVQVSAGVDGDPLLRKPNVAVAFAASEPLPLRFFTVTAGPLTLSVPFQSWVMVCPLARVQRTVQPLIGEVPARTVTSPWNPPGR